MTNSSHRSFLQYVWGQYAMRILGANSARPPVDNFTNFMVGKEPFSDLTTPSALEIPSCIVARGLIFLPQNFAQLILDSTVVLRHARNK